MRKMPFVPPMPYAPEISQEAIDNMKNMTKKERKQFKKSDAYKKYVQPVIDMERKAKRDSSRSWWKNNWISLLSLVFAFIAAIPVIIQGISAILQLLG